MCILWLICAILAIFLCSYDGGWYGGLGEPPNRGRSPQSPIRHSYNNKSESSVCYRTSSAGAADLKKYQGGNSVVVAGKLRKMGDSGAPRSPHFSPARNGKYAPFIACQQFHLTCTDIKFSDTKPINPCVNLHEICHITIQNSKHFLALSFLKRILVI